MSEKNGTLLKVAAGVVVVTGAIVGVTALLDSFLWTESEAHAATLVANEVHTELRDKDTALENQQALQAIRFNNMMERMDSNIQRIGRKIGVEMEKKEGKP